MKDLITKDEQLMVIYFSKFRIYSLFLMIRFNNKNYFNIRKINFGIKPIPDISLCTFQILMIKYRRLIAI